MLLFIIINYSHLLCTMGNVIIHHDHDMVVRDSMCMQQLVSMTHISLEKGERREEKGERTSILLQRLRFAVLL